MAESPPAPRTRRAVEAQNRPTPQVADHGAKREAARRLHEAVRAAGGNQAVASRSGVPLATVNNYVRGRNGMKIGPLSALAAVCNVSLEWIVSGSEAARLPPVADYPTAAAAPPPGLGEAPSEASPAGPTDRIDVRVLAKAIEIVAAIAGAADLLDDPKGLAHRIATTYVVLTEPAASRD
jgi:transcriptional regulator with XRE-family HTH domain